MSIESASSTPAQRAAQFELMLERALRDARNWDYDLPSPLAVRRAREFFPLLADALFDIRSVEVDIGVDGSVEICVPLQESLATIDITPAGQRITAVVAHLPTHEVLWATEDGLPETIIREIVSAA